LTTLDELAAQEQVHFQVITQRIDSLYLNLNSSNNAQTLALKQNISDAINNIGGQLYTQSSRVITSLTARDNAIEQETLGTIRGLFSSQTAKLDEVKTQLQQKLDANLAITLADIDKREGIISTNVRNAMDILFTQIQKNVGETQGLIKDQTDILKREIDLAINNGANNQKDLLNLINDNVKSSAKDTADSISKLNTEVAAANGLYNNGEPAWLTTLMEKLYSGNSTSGSSNNAGFFETLFSIIGGDSAGNLIGAINSSDIVGEIGKQAEKIGQIETDLINGKFKTLDDFNNALKSAGIQSTILGGAVQLLFVIANIGEVIKAFGSPTITKIDQFSRAAYSLKQLGESDILQGFIRNLMSYDEAVKQLDNLGHSKADSELILKNSFPKFAVQDYFKLAHLGKIDANTLKERIRELGFNEIDMILLGYLNQPRPSIQDLISFAVKEVYSPETYTKFGQYQEFPKEFADRAKLEGLDETYAQQYWAAHWSLPGANQGFELFHRGVISRDDVKYLLKALDVMPYWRDKMIELSYNLVGRIDARRLYAYGIWDKNKVYESYVKNGYSPQDAKDLTQFTIQYDDEQDSKHKTALQTKAHNIYIKAYVNKLANKADTKVRLVQLGYKQQDVDLELDLVAYENYVDTHQTKQLNHRAKIITLSLDGYRKRSLSRSDLLDTLTKNGYTTQEANNEADLTDKESDITFKETIVKEIQKLYFESLYDENAVLTKLIQLGFSNAESLKIIGELQILKSLDDKKPTQMQFEKMYKNAIITKEEYKNILAEIGYNSKYIEQIILLGELQ